MIWQMLQNRKFTVVHVKDSSSLTFAIEEGLHQGTVNSSSLFNSCNSDVLNLYNLNENNPLDR